MHSKGQELLKRVAQSFRAPDTYISRDSNIVFLCGGNIHEDTMRSQFRKYARAELPHFHIFLAEDAQRDLVTYEEAEFYNIGEFEEIIGAFAKCVILFLESPGSYAELGYFAKIEEIRRKLLVVNDARLQGQDSFLALGPINIIDRHSLFQPTIQLNFQNNPQLSLVKERLKQRIVPKLKRKKFGERNYQNLTTSHKFYAVFEIINIFRALKLETIEYAFRSIFGNVDIKELKQILSVLVAAHYIERRGDEMEYFCIHHKARPFLDFESLESNAFRLEIMDFYEKHFPEVAAIAKGLSK